MKKLILFFLLLFPVLVLCQPCASEQFAGSDRKEAKTSFTSSEAEVFRTLPGLMVTLPADHHMRSYQPPISREPDSKRVHEEERNVIVETAYIFVMYREKDNDYHIIVGSDSDTSKAILMNIEVSGLPEANSNDYQVMNELRQKIVQHFGRICTKKKLFVDNPVRVTILGSLFYDIDHKPGVVGYRNLKPKTAWEIHPVREIDFR